MRHILCVGTQGYELARCNEIVCKHRCGGFLQACKSASCIWWRKDDWTFGPYWIQCIRRTMQRRYRSWMRPDKGGIGGHVSQWFRGNYSAQVDQNKECQCNSNRRQYETKVSHARHWLRSLAYDAVSEISIYDQARCCTRIQLSIASLSTTERLLRKRHSMTCQLKSGISCTVLTTISSCTFRGRMRQTRRSSQTTLTQFSATDKDMRNLTAGTVSSVLKNSS